MEHFHFDATNTFCISLSDADARWEKMMRRFANLHLDVSRWQAARPADVIDRFYENLNPFQKACAQSHLNIWRFLACSLDYALILEDDACFDRKWREKLDRFLIEVKDPDWDAIFLNASKPLPIIDRWIRVEEQYLAGGYILSNRGVKKLLAKFSGCFASADWMTSRLQLEQHCYSSFPWLIIQEGKESTICGEVEADHAKVLRCLKFVNYGLENYDI